MANVNDYLDEQDADALSLQVVEPEMVEPEMVEQRGFAIPEWLKAKTGDGPIEKYIDHPLNFKGSRSMAQIIRGLTGILGTLEYAVLDIALGVFQMGKEKKAAISIPLPTKANYE